MLFPGNSRWNPYLSGADRSSSEMTVRRNRFASVPPGYFASTKGHSALRKWSYAPPSRASVYAEDIYYPEAYIRPRGYYDTAREENEIRRDVNSELIYTSNLLDDTYDVAAKSRNRDQILLRDATKALPSSNKPADQKTGASLTPARRFQTPRSPPIPASYFTKSPTAYPRLAPPVYKGTTNVQPLGILTQLDWSSPLRKYAPPGRIHELNYEDDSSEISPYATPTQSARSSPERDTGTRPRKLRGTIGPKRRVSNYYNRLVQRRAARPGSNVKYYPYMDVESVTSDDVGDVVSNHGEYRYDNQADVSDAGTGEYYVVDRERSPSPIEYVPFGPRSRINFDSGEYDCQVPSLSDLSMSPYTGISQEDKNISSDKSRISDDLLFHNIVGRTASKARDALRNVDLDEYDNASLIISVEGEYKDPIKGENMGFHYIARPLTLKGPMLSGPATYASTASDSAFSRYMDDMRSFRAEIRNRLEAGYKSLSEVSTKYPSHSYPIIASSRRSYSRALSPPRGSSPIPRSSSPVHTYRTQSLPIGNLRKRLEEIEGKHRRSEYGKRLEEDISADRLVVYPLSEKGSIAAITAPDALPGHTKTVDLYQASAKGNELSTLEKINIKVDTETYASPRSSVTSRRIRATTVAPRATSVVSRAVSCPPTSSRRSNQVVVVLSSPAFKGGSRIFTAKSAMAKREQSLPPSPREQLERRVSARRFINTVAGPYLLPMYQPYQSIYQPYISMYRPHYVRRYFATTRDVIADKHPERVVTQPLIRIKYRKAALVGNKVDVNLPHRRKPRSTYAANRMRELKRDEREYEVEAVPLQHTTSLKASSVTPNYIDGGRSYRDGEGNFTEPKNLMSWKYRIESRVPPGDYFFPIKTIEHVRDRLRHVKEQMDRHKQLMDRYLPDDDTSATTDVKTKIMNMYVDMEQHNPYLFRGKEGLLTPQSSDNSSDSSIRAPSPRRAAQQYPSLQESADYKPMSDVRRRVRRVICKNRGNPRYFKTD